MNDSIIKTLRWPTVTLVIALLLFFLYWERGLVRYQLIDEGKGLGVKIQWNVGGYESCETVCAKSFHQENDKKLPEMKDFN
jgi:hypothetical protein